jgi:hypothetical protein
VPPQRVTCFMYYGCGLPPHHTQTPPTTHTQLSCCGRPFAAAATTWKPMCGSCSACTPPRPAAVLVTTGEALVCCRLLGWCRQRCKLRSGQSDGRCASSERLHCKHLQALAGACPCDQLQSSSCLSRQYGCFTTGQPNVVPPMSINRRSEKMSAAICHGAIAMKWCRAKLV